MIPRLTKYLNNFHLKKNKKNNIILYEINNFAIFKKLTPRSSSQV